MTKPSNLAVGPAERLMTVKDVANRTQLSERTVHRLIAKKQLRVIRIGTSIRVTEQALQALLTGIAKP